MRYRDVINRGSDRFRLPSSHPILAEITIDPADWYRLQQLCTEDPTTRILGRDDPEDGKMVAYVACLSDAVRDRLEDGSLGLMDVRH